MERRQYRRIPLEASVAFREISFQKEADYSEQTALDASGGGLLINSLVHHAQGTLLKLEIRVPGWRRPSAHTQDNPDLLVAVGQVVHVQAVGGSYELGVKFLNAQPDDWTAFIAHVNETVSVHAR